MHRQASQAHAEQKLRESDVAGHLATLRAKKETAA
jgi:hypothetical protein